MSEQFNPYQSPTAEMEATEAFDELPLAGNGRRFLTFLLDYIAIMIFVAVVFAIGEVTGLNLVRRMEKVPDFILNITTMTAFYVVFEGMWGRTPGKLILGTMVVTDENERPSIKTVFIRTLCRFIPFEPLSFFGERGWHDSISDTKVVLTRSRKR